MLFLQFFWLSAVVNLKLYSNCCAKSRSIFGRREYVTNIEAENRAKAVMAAHIEALNAQNQEVLAATLHFPHYRLSGHRLAVWETPETYFADFRQRAEPDWHHSEWDALTVIASDPGKVHLDVKFSRFDAAGRRLGRYRSLWVITEIDGIWAAQFRSTFAP